MDTGKTKSNHDDNGTACTALSPQDLDDILTGACILGAGGGGPYSLGKWLAEKIVASGKPVRVVAPRDVADDVRLAVSAGVGSPEAAAEGFPMDAAPRAFAELDSIQRAGGRAPLALVLPGEIGAGNSLLPMTVCIEKDLPLVDASGADRAIPTLGVATYAAAHLPVSPVVLGNRDLVIRFDAPDANTADTTMRGIISGGAFQEDAGVAFWAMSGAEMKRAAIAGTLTRARELGAQVREALSKKKDPVEAACSYLKGRLMFVGKLADVSETTAGGFDLGVLSLKSGRATMRIYNQNENLFVWDDVRDRPRALSPDLVCTMTTKGQPLSNADIDANREALADAEIAVLGVPADRAMRQESIVAGFLALMRPLGYGGPYVPIEELWG